MGSDLIRLLYPSTHRTALGKQISISKTERGSGEAKDAVP